MKRRSLDESAVQIKFPDGRETGIFDVSPTVEYLWVGVSNEQAYLLEIFKSTDEMLRYVARAQSRGAITTDKPFLEEFAIASGFESWAEFVADEVG